MRPLQLLHEYMTPITGIIVAFLYCFRNKEVLSHLKIVGSVARNGSFHDRAFSNSVSAGKFELP
jgi:hypothetical protein